MISENLEMIRVNLISSRRQSVHKNNWHFVTSGTSDWRIKTDRQTDKADDCTCAGWLTERAQTDHGQD